MDTITSFFTRTFTPKKQCYYYNNGKMYHCLCDYCEQVVCKKCIIKKWMFSNHCIEVCEEHRPMIEFRSDE